MSKNIVIQEGGTPFPFGPVKALLVGGSDGKYYPWVPESERQLGYKSIDKNGIYRASDDGVYGWGSVSVSVSQATSVTGRDPDTGEEVVVKPDPETGDLVETVVPVEIRVIEPPTNPYGVYVDGQTITKDGMVVKAYGANGDEMQTVPIGEITLNPNRAVYDPAADTGHAQYDDDSFVYRAGGTVTISSQTLESEESYVAISGDGPFYAFGTAYTSPGESPNMGRGGFICSPNPFTATRNGTRFNISSYTYDGKNVYYTGRNAYQGYFNPTVDAPVNVIDTNQAKVRWIAWVICYGTRTEGGNQTITVSWPRPGDGAILETTFDITVQQSFGGASGGGGQAGGTGVGRND